MSPYHPHDDRIDRLLTLLAAWTCLWLDARGRAEKRRVWWPPWIIYTYIEIMANHRMDCLGQTINRLAKERHDDLREVAGDT